MRHSTTFAKQRLHLACSGALFAAVIASAAATTRADDAQDKPQNPAPAKTPKPADATIAPTALDEAIEALAGAEEVVVTGTRAPVVPRAWPGGRTVLSPADVRASGADTVYGLLERAPGVHVEQEAGNDTKPNIAMRGLRAERTNETTILVDGIPLSPAPYGHPGLSLFPFTLERVWAVDVIRSGYATRYGPNNVAGVINFLTPPIPDRPTFSERMKFGEDGFRSFYTTLGGTFATDGGGDFGVLYEDVRKSGDTYRDNGEFEARNRGVKAAWRINDEHRLLLQYDIYEDESRLAGGLNDDDYEDDRFRTRTPRDYFEGDQQRGNVRWIWEPDTRTRFELLAYAYGSFRTFHLGSPNQYGPAPKSFQDTPRRMTTAAVAPTFTKSFDIGPVVNTLSIGARLQRELIHTETHRLTLASHTSEVRADQVHEYLAFAPWIEDTARWGRLAVTLGMRQESIDIDAFDRLEQYDVEEDVTERLPSIGVSYDVTDDATIFWTKHEGFRPPLFNHVTPNDTYEGLDIERSETWDIGGRARFLDGLFSAEATYFHIDFKNRFIPDPVDPDHQINAGEQKQSGWEIGTRSDLGRLADPLEGLEVYFTATLLHSRQLSGDFAGNELGDTPRRRFAWGAVYRHKCGARIGVDGVHVGRSFGDVNNDKVPSADGVSGLNPSYTTWSARVGYDTTLGDARDDHVWKLGVEVGVNNLFDEESFNRFGSRGIVPNPPRQVWAGVSVGFEW